MLNEGGNITDIAFDAKPVMLFKSLKGETESFVMVDLFYSENVRFLGNLKSSDNPFENPFWAAGQVFLSSSLDTLLGQAFYNPYIGQITEELILASVFSVPVSSVFPKLVVRPIRFSST